MSAVPTSVLVRIDATVPWEAAWDPDTGTYIGVCRPLNLNAIGDTWQEFQECANDAIALLLTSLLQHDELAVFLRQNGWTLRTPLPPPGVVVRWDVPSAVQVRARADELVPA